MENPQPSSSRNLARAGNSLTDIPHDLTLEILSKLPPKALFRFQSVSKLWSSVITSKDFAKSFLNRSRSRPRLLMTYNVSGKCFIFSAPEHQDNHDDKSSKVLARHDMSVSYTKYYSIFCPPVNGFLCCIIGGAWIEVCNPTTKQTVRLPYVDHKRRGYMFMNAHLGYDPVEDQYKVLCVTTFKTEQELLVCTVCSGQELKWRKIHTVAIDPYPFVGSQRICMDGAIYYGVGHTTIARFDVRLEKIDYIQGPEGYQISYFSKLITYQGKLAVVSYNYDYESQISLWILQDAEKQEWSSVMTCDVPQKYRCLCAGEIHTNELLMIPNLVKSSCVYYCNMITKNIRRVEVGGIDVAYNFGVLYFSAYVENITLL